MTPAARRRGTSKDTPTTARADQPAETTAARPSADRVPRSLYLDKELLDRARAAVTFLAAYIPDSGVRSLSDIFEPAGWAEVKRLEKEFNKGKPFRPVSRMPTGRPQS